MPASVKKTVSKVSTESSKRDSGSSSYQVTQLTSTIKELTEHVKLHKHDFMARRGLLQSVGKRRRLLQYIAKKDPEQYLKLIKDLGLRH
ncbi:MAG TPA: 30S ribosomal protein S15 [Candidatus Saccharimonadia bacterium]|nr:30S ribosomal protein S15 [Candidatus Saccharimonadia bacterium]